MLKRTYRSLSCAIVGIFIVIVAVNCFGQGQKLAVFVQSAAAVPTADLELLTADPVEAAKRAIDTALFQLAVAL